VNAADRKRQRDAQLLERRRESRYREAVAEVMGTEAGRLVLWEFLSKAGVYSSCFDTQTTRMAALAGQQSYGQSVLALLLEVDEDLYDVMAREARQRARQDKAEYEAAELDAERRKEAEE
jgi:hypothetical protein